MKNPFEKDDHKVLIAGIMVGTVVAGAAAYFFLTKTGSEVRAQWAEHFGRMRDAFLGVDRPAESETETEPAYLQHKRKTPKTDREQLLKHTIITGSGENEGATAAAEGH